MNILKSKKLNYKKYSGSSASGWKRDWTDVLSRAYNEETQTYGEDFALHLTNGCCFYCNKKLYDLDSQDTVFFKDYQWDHFIPSAVGGLLVEGNTVLACSSCNLEKSDMPAEDYWRFRVSSKLPVRFKTFQEFSEVSEKLLNIYKNNPYFYLTKTSSDELLLKLLEALNTPRVKEMIKNYTSKSCGADKIPVMADAPMWEAVWDIHSYAYDKYNSSSTDETRVSARSRVGRAIDVYCELFGANKKINEISESELITFISETLKTCTGSTSSAKSKVIYLFRIMACTSTFDISLDKMNELIEKAKLL